MKKKFIYFAKIERIGTENDFTLHKFFLLIIDLQKNIQERNKQYQNKLRDTCRAKHSFCVNGITNNSLRCTCLVNQHTQIGYYSRMLQQFLVSDNKSQYPKQLTTTKLRYQKLLLLEHKTTHTDNQQQSRLLRNTITIWTVPLHHIGQFQMLFMFGLCLVFRFDPIVSLHWRRIRSEVGIGSDRWTKDCCIVPGRSLFLVAEDRRIFKHQGQCKVFLSLH